MGLCSSCCRRRKPRPEKEPLLPQSDQLTKLAEVVAALKSGKLPSQSQTNVILAKGREYLRDDPPPSSVYSHKIVLELRDTFDALREFGSQKNEDDKLQDLYYRVARITRVPSRGMPDVEVEANVSLNTDGNALPPQEEVVEDLAELTRSTVQVIKLLVKSAAFRQLLSDFFVLGRHIVAESAADVAIVAEQVEVAAIDVKESAESPEAHDISPENIMKKANERLEAIHPASSRLSDIDSQVKDRLGDSVLNRIHQTLLLASQQSQYREAVTTLLLLFSKYLEMLQRSSHALAHAHADVTPHLSLPVDLSISIADLKVILERMAGNKSLDPAIIHFERAVRLVLESPESMEPVQEYFRYLHQFLLSSLSRGTEYIQSSEFLGQLKHHYHLGRTIFDEKVEEPWVHSLKLFFQELQAFLDSLLSDQTTKRLIHALSRLLSETPAEITKAIQEGSHRVRNEIIYEDILGYLLPRLLRALHSVPLPRFELAVSQSNGTSLELALDALLMLAGSSHLSLAPDEVVVRTWNETRILMNDSLRAEAEESDRTPLLSSAPAPQGYSSRVMIRISGIRLAIRDVGYYVRYVSAPLLHFFGFSYMDSGFLNLLIGSEKPNTGLHLSIELEGGTTSSKLFEVSSVSSSFPGLTFSLDHSRHWILNRAILLPIARPAVRPILSLVVNKQLRQFLEAMEQFLARVIRDAQATGEDTGNPEWSTYFNVFVHHFGDLFQSPPPQDVNVESSTHATLKGITHTTVTRPAEDTSTLDEGDSGPTETTTTIAVGVAPQLVTSSALPTNDALPKAQMVAQEVVSEIQDGLNEVSSEAVRLRASLDLAARHEADRERVEGKREGWRSHTFDFEQPHSEIS